MVTESSSGPSSDVDAETGSEKARVVGSLGVPTSPSWVDQDEVLRAMWTDNKTPDEISAVLGRSVAAIMTRAARLGLPRRAAPGRKRGYKRSEAPRRVAPAAGARVRVLVPSDQDEEEVYAQPQSMMRVCLMCLNKFQSQGRHNRICPSCKGSAEYATGSSTPDFTFKVIS